MKPSRTHLALPLFSSTQLAEFTLTALGIVGLLVGIVIMPSLEMTETGFYLGLLALVAFMLLSFCAGQLVVIRDRVSKRTNE